MTKKQPEIEQTPEEILVASDQVKSEPLWVMGQWADMPQWRCSFCPFDTLDGEAVMLAHWQAEHAPPAPVVTPPTIQIYDRWGNPRKE